MKSGIASLLAGLAILTTERTNAITASLIPTYTIIKLNNNGAWSWFVDERVMVDLAALTLESTEDHLRPLIPIRRNKKLALVWMSGRYLANRGEWTTRVMAAELARDK